MTEPNRNELRDKKKAARKLIAGRYLDLFCLAFVSILICSILKPGLEIVGGKFLSLISDWPGWLQTLQVALITGGFWALLI